MPRPLIPIDAEVALARDIETITGITTAPTPIPEDLGAELPFVEVMGTGGRRTSLTVDEFTFSIGCYGMRPGAALDVARRAAAAVEFLDTGLFHSKAQWLRTSIDVQPYADPDPRHADIPRYSFTCTAEARAVAGGVSESLI